MRIIVGVSGATGSIMSSFLLKALKNLKCETHLVVSDYGRYNWELETGTCITELIKLADFHHSANDLAASISSGSYCTDGMIVMPCSMKTLAGIVTGFTDNLLIRAVDVCLKENRKVVLVPREMPLGQVHLNNLLCASKLGCAIIPPMLTFYNHPNSLDDQIHHIVGKVLMQFGLITPEFSPWEGR